MILLPILILVFHLFYAKTQIAGEDLELFDPVDDYEDEDPELSEFNKFTFRGDDHEDQVLRIHLYYKIQIQSRTAVSDPTSLWDNGIVPYKLSGNFSDEEKAAIKEAADEFRRKTCIDFRPQTNEDQFLVIEPGNGCSADIGKIERNINNTISLEEGCFLKKGVLLHEMMHVLGFVHEHNRPDRDEYIKIIEENIMEDHKSNFNKYTWDEAMTLNFSYDYGSVMHYSSKAFAKNKENATIIPLKDGVEIGQRDGFSEIDVLKIKKFYKCPGYDPINSSQINDDSSSEFDTPVISGRGIFRRTLRKLFRPIIRWWNRVVLKKKEYYDKYQPDKKQSTTAKNRNIGITTSRPKPIYKITNASTIKVLTPPMYVPVSPNKVLAPPVYAPATPIKVPAHPEYASVTPINAHAPPVYAPPVPPIKVHAPSVYAPVPPINVPAHPEYASVTPINAPAPPVYVPVPSNKLPAPLVYASAPPIKVLAPPGYAYVSPIKVTTPPVYEPVPPIYIPASPVYAPVNPIKVSPPTVYAPVRPIHIPAPPAYVPAAPVPVKVTRPPMYAPVAPTYVPAHFAYVPVAPITATAPSAYAPVPSIKIQAPSGYAPVATISVPDPFVYSSADPINVPAPPMYTSAPLIKAPSLSIYAPKPPIKIFTHFKYKPPIKYQTPVNKFTVKYTSKKPVQEIFKIFPTNEYSVQILTPGNYKIIHISGIIENIPTQKIYKIIPTIGSTAKKPFPTTYKVLSTTDSLTALVTTDKTTVLETTTVDTTTTTESTETSTVGTKIVETTAAETTTSGTTITETTTSGTTTDESTTSGTTIAEITSAGTTIAETTSTETTIVETTTTTPGTIIAETPTTIGTTIIETITTKGTTISEITTSGTTIAETATTPGITIAKTSTIPGTTIAETPTTAGTTIVETTTTEGTTISETATTPGTTIAETTTTGTTIAETTTNGTTVAETTATETTIGEITITETTPEITISDRTTSRISTTKSIRVIIPPILGKRPCGCIPLLIIKRPCNCNPLIKFLRKSSSQEFVNETGTIDNSLLFDTGAHAINFHQIQIIQTVQPRTGVSNPKQLWSEGIIPYTLSDKYGDFQKRMILDTMEEFHNKTCVRFVNRTDEVTYVFMQPEDRCAATIGFHEKGVNGVKLGEGCFDKGTIIHELMHVLGFIHEQNRPDRDKYVKIIWDNIESKFKHDFKKYNWTQVQSLGQSYDYESIMHYGAFEFAINESKPTIIPLKEGAKIGQRDYFSQKDLIKINRLYECQGEEPSVSERNALSTDIEEFKEYFLTLLQSHFESIQQSVKSFIPSPLLRFFY